MGGRGECQANKVSLRDFWLARVELRTRAGGLKVKRYHPGRATPGLRKPQEESNERLGDGKVVIS